MIGGGSGRSSEARNRNGMGELGTGWWGRGDMLGRERGGEGETWDDGKVLGGRNEMGKTVMGNLEDRDPECHAYYMLICTKCLHTILSWKTSLSFSLFT